MENKAIFEVKCASYSYMNRFSALNNIDLNVAGSEKLALLGANGSGKSTLLMVLAGLVFPTTGSIKFLGEDLDEKALSEPEFNRKFRTMVGIVFQNSDMQLFNSNVEDELLFGLVQLGLSQEEIDKRIRKYSSLMDITHLMDRHPQNLSIGEKKRVAIASVLAMEPEIMLLDEPTSGLDPRTTRHLIDAMNAFSAEGRTIITSTQDIHIVPEIADRIVVLGEDKSIVKNGRAEEVLGDAEFLAKHNLLHTHIHKHKDTAHVHPHEHPSHDHSHGT